MNDQGIIFSGGKTTRNTGDTGAAIEDDDSGAAVLKRVNDNDDDPRAKLLTAFQGIESETRSGLFRTDDKGAHIHCSPLFRP